MDTGIPRSEQYLPLRVAAALLHIRVVGAAPSATDTRRMQATLNDVARALSMLAPIYYFESESSLPVKVPESAVIGASFSGGASVLVGADGIQYENLTVRRVDLDCAGQILGASTNLQKRWADGQEPS